MNGCVMLQVVAVVATIAAAAYCTSVQLTVHHGCVMLQVSVIIATLAAAVYCYYYFDNVHFHVTHGYAHLGYASAQHQVGQRYLNGMYTAFSSLALLVSIN